MLLVLCGTFRRRRFSRCSPSCSFVSAANYQRTFIPIPWSELISVIAHLYQHRIKGELLRRLNYPLLFDCLFCFFHNLRRVGEALPIRAGHFKTAGFSQVDCSVSGKKKNPVEQTNTRRLHLSGY